MEGKVKVLFVANIPAPYRITLFNLLNKNEDIDFLVLYCAYTESNRGWSNLDLQHPYVFLKENRITKALGIKYLNKNVIKNIRNYKPDIIVTGGFFPTMMLTILYARIFNIKHFINTDAWYINEQNYKWYHILIRRIVYKSTTAFLPVSEKGKQNLIHNYNISPERIFIVPYSVDKFMYKPNDNVPKKHDLIFVGQLIERKQPDFVIKVLNKIKESKRDVTFLLIGDGPLRESILSKLKEYNINYHYLGYLQPSQIIQFYKESKVLLFPTSADGWGVVANEAISLGVPCITNNTAGCAHELVINDYSGYVLELDIDKWAKKILNILSDDKLQLRLKNNCLLQIEKFTPEVALQEFERAINFSLKNEKS